MLGAWLVGRGMDASKKNYRGYIRERGAIAEPIGTTALLLRLHDGDFQFPARKRTGAICASWRRMTKRS